MSFKSKLVHQCDLYNLEAVYTDGSPVTKYVKVNTKPIRCRIDLNFIRQGKDPMWMPTIARPDDRTGVMFFMPDAPVKAGMRAKIIKGPKGIFQFKSAIDEAWGYSSIEHLEVGVAEVSTLTFREPQSQGGM